MKKIDAFTLIEVLVVIAILAGLVVILYPNFMDMRIRARDTQRKSDLKQIQKALESYKDDQYPPSYIPTANFPTVCSTWSESGHMYMSKVPGDPSGTCATPKKYYYVRNPTGTIGETLEYLLGACLENTTDPDLVTCPDDFFTVSGIACSFPRKCYLITQP
ncbi:MAG: prepilin-type N-terminal cleavage/methylation domain-containing protein [Patescibacteria group bacterium]